MHFKDPEKVEWVKLDAEHYLVKAYAEPGEQRNIDVLEDDDLEEWLRFFCYDNFQNLKNFPPSAGY